MRYSLFIINLFLGLSVAGQDYVDIIQLLNADLHHEKHAIVLTNMEMTEEQLALFEPIYAEYTATFEPYWQERLTHIDDLADARDSMSDETALALIERLSDLEKRNIAIRDEYASEMLDVLPAPVVARWVQLERRLVKLMELQVANQIPLMPTKP